MESRLPLVAPWILAAGVSLGTFGCGDEGPVAPPVAPPFAARSADDVVSALQNAYAGQDYDLFAALIASDSGATYEFHFPESFPGGATSWDAMEELRIHRRLLEPENVLPGEPPGTCGSMRIFPNFEGEPPGWIERPEFYRSASNPAGLDPDRWRATGTGVRSECLIDSRSDTDYRIQNRSEFVVIEDRTKSLGAERKFLLYRWVDLDGAWKALKVACL